MNGNQWGRGGKQNGPHRQGAKPTALGWLEGWRSWEQAHPCPHPHMLRLYANHPKPVSQFQPFSHFLSPKDRKIKHRFSRERMRHAGGGGEASPPAASSHSIAAFGTKPWGLSCIRAAGTPRGWASRELPRAAAQAPALYQQETHPLSSSL